jgi:hypothetical protein
MFADSERLIFQAEAGAGRRWYDPQRVYRRLLMATGGDLAAAIAAAQRPGPRPADPRHAATLEEALAKEAGLEAPDEAGPGPAGPVPLEVLQAEERLLDAVRFAFELSPLDPETGSGTPDELCWAALAAYSEFVGQKKRTPPASPNGRSAGDSSPARSTTENTSGSGS